ncbi:MAG: chemotaxis protein CheX [Syntrophales bacterium]|nr:chemotaxis protein CheX [Syntrophales bacterium]
MKENIRQTVTKATFEVFEKMFFVFLEPVEDTPFKYDSVSYIDFSGRATGGLCLMMSRGLTAMMAENMLGCEPSEITEQMIEDCSKEAANMVCGNFLRKMSEQDVFNLSLPQYAPMDQAAGKGLILSGPDDIVVHFESEDEHLRVRLAWKEAGEA